MLCKILNISSWIFLSCFVGFIVPVFAVDEVQIDPEQSQSVPVERTVRDESWVDLISSEGPQGLVGIGRNTALCSDVKLDIDSKKLVAIPGTGVVATLENYRHGTVNNLVSKQSFGDCELHLEFLLTAGSNSGVKLQKRYEIQLYDSYDKKKVLATDCGGIYPHWIFQGRGKPLKYLDKGVPPMTNAAKPAGEWQTLKIIFEAARFNSSGDKIKDARFVSVMINKQEVHRNVEVDSPTGNASTPLPEVPKAPLLLQLDHGAVAFRNVKIRKLP